MEIVIQKIIAAFSPYHMGETACDDFWFAQKVREYIKQEKPIDFLLLAFPGKSINPNSVSGYFPDLGEYLALGNLRILLQEISKIYSPGATLHIISDGYFFMHTGCIRPEHELDAYFDKINQIKKSDRIKFYRIHDFYNANSLDQKIDIFEKQYLPDMAEVYNAIENDPYYRRIYPDRIAFIYHEFTPVLFADHSNSRRHAMAKLIARSFIGYQMAVNSLIKDYFTDHIRLSIHQQHDPASKKYYIDMLPNVAGKGTPWFYEIKSKNRHMFLEKRKAA